MVEQDLAVCISLDPAGEEDIFRVGVADDVLREVHEFTLATPAKDTSASVLPTSERDRQGITTRLSFT